jgi:hypothetical protein
MRQPRTSPEHETLTKQPKIERKSVDKKQISEREQLPATGLRDSQARLFVIAGSAMDTTVVVCGHLPDQRRCSLSSLR